MDRQPGALIRLVADVFPRLHIAINSVFRPEQRDELHARRIAQQVNRRFAVAIDAGRIRYQPDTFSVQFLEAIRGENLAAELHLSPGC